MEMEDSKSVLIIAPSDRKFRVDVKSNSSQSDLELIKLSFEDICLKDFALKQIVDSSDSHFIFKKFDPLFKCEVEITDKDVIEHGSVLHVTIISSVLANLSKLPGTSTASDNETLSKTEETILPIPESQASTSKPSSNIQPSNQNMQSIQSFITGCLPTLSNSTIKSVMKILVESGVQAVDDLKEIDPEKKFNGVLKVIHARKLKEAIQLASKNGNFLLESEEEEIEKESKTKAGRMLLESEENELAVINQDKENFPKTRKDKLKRKAAYSFLHPNNKNSSDSSFSGTDDSDLDYSFTPLKLSYREQKWCKIQRSRRVDLKAENNDLQNKYFKLKEKHSKLKSRNQELLNLNLNLQKLSNDPVCKDVEDSAPAISQHAQNELTTNKQMSMEVVKSKKIPSKEKTPFVKETDAEDERFKTALNRVKPGAWGDRQYAKNLSVIIFGNKVLAASSVTGSKCNNNKDSTAKPPLCPLKMRKLRDLFIKRIKRENSLVSELEILSRCKAINPAVAEKIVTIMRSKNR